MLDLLCLISNFFLFSDQLNLLTQNLVYAVVLDTPLDYSLDDCIEYIQEDELVEVTPLSIRMCKNPKFVKRGR